MAGQPETIGRYQLRGVLGQGGFATVYRAYDPVLRRETALKILSAALATQPDTRDRFLAEARVLAQLRHPNIVVVYDVGEVDDCPFYTMELIDGQTLAQLGSARRLPLTDVLTWLRPLAAAIDALHDGGLVHRDLKPANVMVDRTGRLVLMDFGIAQIPDRTRSTLAGTLLGTPTYMAPEQVLGQPVGRAADSYALGVILYELLAGRPPFRGDTVTLLHAHAYEAPPPLTGLRPDLPRTVCEVVHLLLAKDPARRPPRAQQVVDALVGTDTPTLDAPTLALPRQRRTGPSRRWGAVVAGAGMLVVLVGVGLVLRSARSGVPDATRTPVAAVGSPFIAAVPSPTIPPPPQMPSTSPITTPVTVEPEQLRQVIELSHVLWGQAVGEGGTTARLAEVYSEPRLSEVASIVASLRANRQYRESTRRAMTYRSIRQLGPDTARVETTEEWDDFQYTADGLLVDDVSQREDDAYLLQRTGSGWRIVRDQVTNRVSTSDSVWTVIIDSLAVAEGKTRQDADRQAASVRARGTEADVLFSNDYRSLNRGYWVVYSGRFRTKAEVDAHAAVLRQRGYSASYPRLIAR